jgi:predicted transposase YdaD
LIVEYYEEGKTVGKAEGKAESEKEIVRNGLKQGLDIQLITALTGLSKDKIEQIRDEN